MTELSTRKNLIRATGYFFIAIFSGMLVYDSPPESWAQLGEWIWQPALNGALAAMTSLGLNHVVK